MKVYHGSTVEILNPRVDFSKRNLDFGPGFYVTTKKSQAENWASRKAIRTGTSAVVNAYEMDEDCTGFRKKEFLGNDEEWVEFVCACRRGSSVFKQYDIIIGGVANDKVYRVVDMYYRGIWDMERTLKEMFFYKENDQICFLDQKLLDSHLAFLESYEVREHENSN